MITCNLPIQFTRQFDGFDVSGGLHISPMTANTLWDLIILIIPYMFVHVTVEAVLCHMCNYIQFEGSDVSEGLPIPGHDETCITNSAPMTDCDVYNGFYGEVTQCMKIDTRATISTSGMHDLKQQPYPTNHIPSGVKLRQGGQGAQCPLAAFTGLANQSYRAGEDIEEGERRGKKGEERKEKRERRKRRG